MNDGSIDPAALARTQEAGATARSAGVQAPGSSAAPGDGAAFRALLDKLAGSAERLRESESGVNDAESLAGAVEDARSTLSDALSLQEQLLEAYRQRRAQGE